VGAGQGGGNDGQKALLGARLNNGGFTTRPRGKGLTERELNAVVGVQERRHAAPPSRG